MAKKSKSRKKTAGYLKSLLSEEPSSKKDKKSKKLLLDEPIQSNAKKFKSRKKTKEKVSRFPKPTEDDNIMPVVEKQIQDIYKFVTREENVVVDIPDKAALRKKTMRRVCTFIIVLIIIIVLLILFFIGFAYA